MKISGYKIKALFTKDLKNIFRNPNVLIMLLMPIGFALFYSYMLNGEEDGASYFVYNLCALLNMGVVPISIVGMNIAEEREKSTLRTLILSNVSAAEFMIAKLLIGLVLFMLTSVLIFFISAMPMNDFVWYMFITFITSIAALMFGAVVGMVAKDQMSTGYYGTPVMLLFMAPLFGAVDSFIGNITQFIPTQSMIYLQNITSINEIINGKGIFSIVVIVVWIVAAFVIFRYVYKKNSLDN